VGVKEKVIDQFGSVKRQLLETLDEDGLKALNG
jgi:hypothetical protein